ncbi:MAG: hypothetical protein U0836_25075 [Pirellulales bacterium]
MAELNTADFGELGLTLTPDGLEAFFSRATPEALDPTLLKQAEIYTARRTNLNDPFGVPSKVAELVPPTGFRDLAPSISADGLTLYYSQASVVGSEVDRRSSGRIFSASRPSRDAPFGAPQEVAGLREPSSIDGMNRPEISNDGLSLYMQYLPLGGERDSNVYVAHRTNVNDPWGLAEPVAEFASTELWESSPAITSDDKGLFVELTWQHMESELPDLRGDSEVYFSQRDEQGSWSTPINLGDAINKPGVYTWDPYLTADGSMLYFNRMVNSELVSNDLYQAPVLPITAVPLAGHGARTSRASIRWAARASLPIRPSPAAGRSLPTT